MWVSRSSLPAGLRKPEYPAPSPEVQHQTQAGDHPASEPYLHLFSPGFHRPDQLQAVGVELDD